MEATNNHDIFPHVGSVYDIFLFLRLFDFVIDLFDYFAHDVFDDALVFVSHQTDGE